jgi:trigger factor
MKANAERVEKNTVLLEIELDAEQFSQAVEKAYRKLVKKVNIPGFRKGKAPRPVFERFVGKEALYEDAMESLVPEAYLDAVKETGIEPIERPRMEIVQAEEGKPVVLKAKVQVKPEVVLGAYKGLEAVKREVEINPADIVKELERLQNRHCKVLNLQEGIVENGDTVQLDFLGTVDNIPFPGGEGKDYHLTIGSGSFIPGFEDQLVGMSIGETRGIFVTFPQEYHATELAGKDASFTVTVKSLKRKELAPLDDEFAKDVSEFDTLEELREDIGNKLKKAAGDMNSFRMKQETVEKAVKNAEVEIPETMIEDQLKDMLQSMENRMLNQGLDLKTYLEYAKKSMIELRQEMLPDAEAGVKTNLVLEAISKAEDIKASEEEIKEEAGKMAESYQQDPEEFYKMLEKEDQLDFIAGSVIKEKTVQYLVDNAKIVEESKEDTKVEDVE